MKKTVLIILLALCCAGLGALYIVERNRRPIDSHSPETAEIPNVGDVDRVTRLEAKLEARELELAKLRRKLTEARGEGAITVVDVPGAGGDEDDVVTATNNLADGLGKMIQQAVMSALGSTNLGNGAMLRELAKTSGSRAMPRRRRMLVYEDLIESLGLNEEKATAFRELLGKQNSGISIQMMGADGDLSKEFGGMLGDLTGSQDSAIRELLGEDDYAKYQSFAETESARVMVSEFEESLTAGNLAISADQRGDLIELFQSVRMADQEGATDLNGGLSFNLNGEQPLDEKVEGSLDSLVARYDNLAKDADAVLNDKQSAQLRTYLDEKLERKEMEGELARNLLQGVSIEGIPNAAIQGSVKVMGPGMSVGVISSSSEMTVPADSGGETRTIQINMGGDTVRETTP